jgi:rare lipoprotein A
LELHLSPSYWEHGFSDLNFLILAIVALPLAGCAPVLTEISRQSSPSRTVKATWYGVGDKPNSHTANGDRFNPYGLTAAHKKMPFGTRLRITNPKNNKSTVVRINDRGPFVKGIEIDLTKGAANAIGMSGTQNVIMEKVH